MRDFFPSIWRWFMGGDVPYHPLTHCMREDWFWISAVVLADLMVWFGYILIAFHWKRQEGQDGEANVATAALGDLKWVFILCGSMYLWTFVDSFLPVWRLMFFIKSALVYKTWKFAVTAPRLGMIYKDLEELKRLRHDVDLLTKERDALKSIMQVREANQ